MKIRILLLLTAVLLTTQLHAQQGFPFDNEIREFKHQDSLKFPPKNGILFIGSSSIRKWTDLEQRFAGKPIIRRGVGGCELWQLVDYYTPYILFPYSPRKIFIYAGENDIAGGKSGTFVFEEFKKLWVMIHAKLPDANIYYLSVKASPSRIRYIQEMNLANGLISKYIATKPKTVFIDMNTAIQKAGTAAADSSLFEADYLHLNSKGYDRWQKVLEPYVR